MNKLIAENRVIFPENIRLQPKLKRFKNELKRDTNPVSTWLADVGLNAEGSREIQEILGGQVFQYPKPRSLIEQLIKVSVPNDAIILDFFAGSGTTAHAVQKLNTEDGGKRRFILVSSTEASEEQPDKNLCRDVCAERVRRVMEGYSNKKGESVAGLGGSFAYLRSRRHPTETLFNSIQHPAIWTALCLIHSQSVSPYQTDAPHQQLALDNSTVWYLPKINPEVLASLNKLPDTTLLVYSWQPGLLRQHIEDARVSFLPIPQFLVDRFGNGGAR